MNMISTGSFLTEMDASNKQETLAEKFAAVWEKKNAKAARAGGVSLMALSLAACGSSDDTADSGTGSGTDSGTDSPTVVVEGLSLVLKTTVDAASGDAGDDTISGVVSSTAAANDGSTLTSADVIDGKGGSDTLKITVADLTNGSTTNVPVVENVETIEIRNVSAANTFTYNAAATTGLETVTISGGLATGSTDVTNIKAGTTINVAGKAATIGFDFDETFSGDADAISVNVSAATIGTSLNLEASANTVETINIANTGASTVILDAGNAVTKVAVTGSGTLTLSETTDSLTAVKTFTATGVAVNADMTDNTAVLSFTGSAGDDTLTLDDGGFAATDTIAMGDGADTFNIGVGNAGAFTWTAALAARVTGVETVGLMVNEAAIGAHSVTMDTAGLFNKVVIGDIKSADAADDTFNFDGMLDGAIVGLGQSIASLDVDLKTDTTSDAITINAGSATNKTAVAVATKVDIDKFESLTLNASGAVAAATVTVADMDADSVKSIRVTGTQNVIFTDISDVVASTTTIDASELKADFTISELGEAVKSITGSATETNAITVANDNVNSAATFVGGAADDDTLVDGGVTGNNGILNISDIETVTLTTGGAFEADLRSVVGLKTLVINSSADNVTLTRMDLATTTLNINESTTNNGTISALIINEDEVGTLKMEFDTDDAADTVTTLTLGAGITAVELTIDAAAAGTDKLVVTNAISATGLTSLTVKGDGIGDFGGTQANTLLTFDASTSTGAQSITLGTGAITVLGGSGNDTLAGGSGAGTFNGNGGADVITVSTGADIIQIDSAAESRASTLAGTDVNMDLNDQIVNFTATGAADRIQLSSANGAYGDFQLSSDTNIIVTDLGDIDGGTDVANIAALITLAAGAATETASSATTLYIYTASIDTSAGAADLDTNDAGEYIFINDGTTAITIADTMIKIDTLTGTLTADDFFIV